MRFERPPYWFWRFDRWNLLVAVLLALLALLLAVRGQVAAPTAAPVFSSPAAGAQLSQAALGEVAGTASPGATVRVFDGDRLLGETIADPQGNFRFQLPPLEVGPHNLTAVVVDRNGWRLRSSAPLLINVSPAARPGAVVPTLTFGDTRTALLEGKPSIASGTAAPAARVQLFDGDTLLGDTIADAGGNWTLGVPALSAGAHTLTVTATGADGVSVASAPLQVMVTPVVVRPAIEVPGTPLALVEGQPGPALAGTAAPGARVQLYDGDRLLGEAVAGPDGRWQIPLPGLAAGERQLVARVTGPDGSSVASEPLAVAVGPAGYPPPYLLTLGPNESAEVPVVGFCLNYGLPFPGATLQPADAAPLPDPVRKGLAYAAARGYTQSDPWQTQLAIWYLAQGKRLRNADYTIADEIIRFAESPGPAPEQGLTVATLLAGLKSGVLAATLQDFVTDQPLQTAYTGRGTLVIKNLSDRAQQVLISYGVRFGDAAATGAQEMAVFPAQQ